MKHCIAITIGDFNGIGPEVILKSISSIKKNIQPILIGSLPIFQFYAKKFNLKLQFEEIEKIPKSFSSTIPVINVHNATEKNIQIGKIAPDSGVCAGLALEKSAKLCLENSVEAMVTAPVSKEAMKLAGYNFPGQTEMLAMLSRSEKVIMMLASSTLRVGLATVHVPLRNVCETLSTNRILEKLETLHTSLKKDFAIENPKIAVLGVNPHAGENGNIGNEEKEIIIPAIQKAQEKNINAVGPFPADGFFATYTPKKYDAVLAMYHDQGLIPLKMSGFYEGVNYSAGLKILRTSPDHGTGFNIAGKNEANPSSMIAALKFATMIIENRNK